MSRSSLQLSGDANVPAMPITDAQVNHLRRLLAWLRCEYMLDEDMQRGFLSAAQHSYQTMPAHMTEHIDAIVEKQAERVNHVPAYVRQAVKMLTKALRDHEARSGVVDAALDQGDSK
jgi:hypothetical protein